jgi:zinc protease
MADLESMSRADLYSYYRRFYRPNNAVLALAGDFETEAMLEKITNYFGPLEAGEPVDPMVRSEPMQHGERRVTVEGMDETPILSLSYRAPAPTEPDFYALAVLDSILSGASSFSPYGSGISNKTSRLYRRLVEGGLAAAVRGGLAATIDPFLYTIRVTVRPDQIAEENLQAVDNEIHRLQDEAVSDEEVAKAIKQAKALFAYDSESISNQAFWLGYSEMFDSYEWFESYLERVSQVTPDELLRVSHRYLVPNQRTVGIYQPVEGVTGG